MSYWFTADLHLQHENIIKYTNRPFKSIKEMNKELIKRWNKKVKKDDVVIVVGDFMFYGGAQGGKHKFSYYQKKLNGDIILVKGNHESNSTKSIIVDMLINHGGKYFHLVHNPRDANSEYNLVGHIHKLWKIKKIKTKPISACFLINVGVDVWDFSPVNITQIIELIEKFKKGKIKEDGTNRDN